MKIYKLAFAFLALLTLSAQVAHAQDALSQLSDVESNSAYAASDDSRSGEDSGDNASASFDGQPSGSTGDSSSLDPSYGNGAYANSDE
ncbi:MAG: hypothetical protein K8R48_09340 [Alphaproteobacteria bacterium]|nr:hypothetical protein [Alphaproteobacteria bacterium]